MKKKREKVIIEINGVKVGWRYELYPKVYRNGEWVHV